MGEKQGIHILLILWNNKNILNALLKNVDKNISGYTKGSITINGLFLFYWIICALEQKCTILASVLITYWKLYHHPSSIQLPQKSSAHASHSSTARDQKYFVDCKHFDIVCLGLCNEKTWRSLILVTFYCKPGYQTIRNYIIASYVGMNFLAPYTGPFIEYASLQANDILQWSSWLLIFLVAMLCSLYNTFETNHLDFLSVVLGMYLCFSYFIIS